MALVLVVPEALAERETLGLGDSEMLLRLVAVPEGSAEMEGEGDEDSVGLPLSALLCEDMALGLVDAEDEVVELVDAVALAFDEALG